MRLSLDFEVFSEINLRETPLDVYAAHQSTKIILCAYAFDDGEVKVWESDKQSTAPADLKTALRDPSVQLNAWNVTYEATVMKHKGLPTPLDRWLDTMVHARYVGLPGKLKDCAKVAMIGVPAEEATKNETLLIRKFCMPNKDGERNKPASAEYDWQLFVDYCRKDVLTMRHIQNWLEPRFPFPESERRLWMLDQVINERGIPVDVEMARHGERETARIVGESFRRMQKVTGLENSNSVQQLHPWLTERGYKYNSLGKEFVKQALEDDITTEAREILTLRLGAAKSSVKKFSVISQMASPEAA